MKTTDALIAQIHRLFNHEIGLMNDYLRLENKILRSKLGKRVPLKEIERRMLAKYGIRIKEHLKEIMSIVKPETLLAWHRRMKKEKWTYDNTPKSPGRPNKGIHTEELILRMARENSWGYRRIAGEMKKLGYQVCKSTVRNILRKNGLPSSPHRKGMSWKRFIESHMDVTWAADFFTEEVWTMGGLITFYVLFFVHLKTRRVHIASCTPTPHAQWTSQQARNFSMILDEIPEKCRYIVHDREASFLPFDHVMKSDGVQIVKTPPQTPMCNAYAERFVREARETLNNIIPLGERHFRHVLKSIEHHHNKERPHQGIGNVIPMDFEYPLEPQNPDKVKRISSLGGLLNHYTIDKKAA